MAASGLEPYAATLASFLALLCAAQIRTDVAYSGLPVRLICDHGGISLGFYGTSHHATEDLAVIRSMAGMTVIAPADGAALAALVRAAADWPGPIYFRIGRGREPDVYTPEQAARMAIGAAVEHRLGREAGEEPDAPDIEVDDVMPLLRGPVRDRFRRRAAGVVEEDVQAVELRDGPRHQPLTLADVGDVGRDDERAAAECLDVGSRLLERLAPPAREDEVSAVLGQDEGAPAPDAAAGAGDDGDTTIEREPAHMTAPPFTLIPRSV